MAGHPAKKVAAGLLTTKQSGQRCGRLLLVAGARPGVTPLVTLVQKDAAGALFSMAGNAGGAGQFSKLLHNVFGRPQRGLWRSRAFIQEQGTADIMKAVDEVIADANKALQQRMAA
jgi:hypothetical protein